MKRWRLSVRPSFRFGPIAWPAHRPVIAGLAFGVFDVTRYLSLSESDRWIERQRAASFRAQQLPRP